MVIHVVGHTNKLYKTLKYGQDERDKKSHHMAEVKI